LNDSQLLHQRKIVLNVPVVGNPAILHAQNVGRDEINSLSRSLLLSKSAIEMAPKMEMCDHVVAGKWNAPPLKRASEAIKATNTKV
jgi:hypothetical protein